MTPQEILRGAAELLEKAGWCTGAMHRKNDRSHSFCMLGAIGEVAGLDVQGMTRENRDTISNWCYTGKTEEHKEAIETVRALVGGTWSWNDRKARKKEDVIDLLRRAAREVSMKKTS